MVVNRYHVRSMYMYFAILGGLESWALLFRLEKVQSFYVVFVPENFPQKVLYFRSAKFRAVLP